MILFDRLARWIPLTRGPATVLILRIFQATWGGFRTGWTPKKIALTLAKLRASPPSIRSAQEGTIKTMTSLNVEKIFPVKRWAFARFRTAAALVSFLPL